MDDYLRSDAPVIEALDRAWDRSRLSVATRLARLRSRAFLLVQCAVAAGVAWWLAADVLGHVAPFFAPVVAVVCLGMSYGQRQRRVLEVAIGVAVGVFVADVFVQVVGTGPVADRGRRARLHGRRVPARRRPGARHPGRRAGHRRRRPGAHPGAGLHPLDRRPHRGRRRPRRGDRRPAGAAASATRRSGRGGAQDQRAAARRRGQRRRPRRRPGGRGARVGPRHGVAAARAAAPRPTRGCRSSPARRSSAGMRRTCARWSSSSNRSTGRCAAPACS